MARTYPVAVKPASDIATWSQWPDDVRDVLHGWNNGHLTFTRSSATFKCVDCERFCEAHEHGAAVLDGDWLCDDCIIGRARR